MINQFKNCRNIFIKSGGYQNVSTSTIGTISPICNINNINNNINNRRSYATFNNSSKVVEILIESKEKKKRVRKGKEVGWRDKAEIAESSYSGINNSPINKIFKIENLNSIENSNNNNEGILIEEKPIRDELLDNTLIITDDIKNERRSEAAKLKAEVTRLRIERQRIDQYEYEYNKSSKNFEKEKNLVRKTTSQIEKMKVLIQNHENVFKDPSYQDFTEAEKEKENGKYQNKLQLLESFKQRLQQSELNVKKLEIDSKLDLELYIESKKKLQNLIDSGEVAYMNTLNFGEDDNDSINNAKEHQTLELEEKDTKKTKPKKQKQEEPVLKTTTTTKTTKKTTTTKKEKEEQPKTIMFTEYYSQVQGNKKEKEIVKEEVKEVKEEVKEVVKNRLESIREMYKDEQEDIFALLKEFESKIGNIDKSKLNEAEAIEVKENENRPGFKYRFYSDQEPYPLVTSRDDYKFDQDFQELEFEDNNLETVHKYGFDDIPTLKHGLERTIRNRGLHPVNSFDGKPNFSSFLSNIHDFDSLVIGTNYMIPSEDKRLIGVATENKSRYLSSTSSITSVLSHLYFLTNKIKAPPTSNFSSSLNGLDERSSYLPSVLKPCSIHLIPIKKGLWSIDNNSGNVERSNGLLMNLGHSMEKMLTLEEDEFNQKLLKENVKDGTPIEFPDAYIYSKFGKLMYRSQIDCKSDLLPEDKNTFDLKTRATNAIRMHSDQPLNHLSYHITRLTTGTSSYEKEFHDLTKTGAIKYSLQAKIGQMAGIFICYHNTKRIFGSEYISLDELEKSVFWSTDMANRSFQMTNTLLQNILDTITKDISPDYTHRVVFCGTRNHNRIHVFIEQLIDKDYPHLEFNYKSQQDLVAGEANQITNPVKMYEVLFGSLVNNKKVFSSLHFAPEDSVRAFYKITELTQNVKVHYAGELRSTRLYSQFSN